MERFQKVNYLLFWSVAVVAWLLDFATKTWALRPGFTGVEVIPKWLKFAPTTNDGIAFSIGVPYWIQIVATLIILSVFLGYATEVICDQKSKALWKLTLLGMTVGGALGNLVDRIRFGHVNDFISVNIFPVFNVADIFITVGIAGLLILLFKTEKK